MSERLNDESTYDVLADVLETLRFRGSIFFRSELAAPWGVAFAAEGIPRFHVALAGNCFVGASDGDPVMLKPREIALLAGGREHWIADEPGRNLVSSARAADVCELSDPLFQDGEITNRIMCGRIEFDKDTPHPILDALPEIMHVGDLSETDPMWSTIALIDAEIERTQRYCGALVDRLTEALFLQLLDYYRSENRESLGFLGALGDRRIDRAFALIHQAPGFKWSLATLGERVGMSRATLVRHFHNAVGVAPMTYVANWRLAKAYNLVKYSSVNLDEIAESVGFATGKSLSKAFLRQYGCSPNKIRKRVQESH